MAVTRLTGLEHRVDVLRDALGIPHVRTHSVHDAFFAQGYVHAQDRLWQMEFDRRKAAGRAAECLGPPAVTLDVFSRRMALAETSRSDFDALDDTTRSVLSAYADGVNAAVDTMQTLPVEFRLLDIEPERWQPWHSICALKARHVLMGTFDRKLWRLHLLNHLGPDAVLGLGSAHGREDVLIVPPGGRAIFTADPGDLAAATGMVDGSNSWALAGSRTASGKPLLAGDSHRTLEAPNVYYQNHVACPDFDAIGFSMPGIPGMFHFGHNERVAWSVTHAMADTQDLFVERFDADGRYQTSGGPRTPERRTETVQVRGSSAVEVDVIVTEHGPVVFGDPREGSAIAMRWTATDRMNTTPRTLLPMLKATSVGELEDVMRDWVDPCNSFVMADVDGTIAYLYRGRVPVRTRANGWTPVPGWTGEHDWTGDVPFEDLPRLRDPEEAYIVTANNRVVGDDYPHYLGMDYGPPNRARRVLERVKDLRDATAEDMTLIHADRISIPSRVFVDAVRSLGPLDGAASQARDILQSWDGSMDPDLAAPAIYVTLRDELAGLLVEREPLAAVVTHPFDEEPYPTPAKTRVRAALAKLISSGDTTLLGGSSWSDAVREALERVVHRLAGELGDDPAVWTWGRIHKTRVRHPLSRLFPEANLDPPAVSSGGDWDTVQASGAEVGLGVQHTSVNRYVFDLADWERSLWVVPLGSSGDPASPHYADQAQTWARVGFYPMSYAWDRVEAEAHAGETLEPRR